MTPQLTTDAAAPATGRVDRPLDLATTVLDGHVNDDGLCAACSGVALPYALAETMAPSNPAAYPVAAPEPAAAASAVRTRVVVAPEIAVQIAAAFTSGTSLATLARQWHLTPGEVARVVAGQAYVAAPEVAPEVRVPRELAAVLLRNVPR